MTVRFRSRALLLFVLLPAVPVGTAAQSSLADIYRGGSVRLVPEFAVTDADLPEEVYFVSFEQSWSTSVDSEGNIYFADYSADHIKVFAPDGTFQRTIGRSGAGPAEFTRPYFSTIANDHLVVWDMGNTRFCILTLEGELVHTRPLDWAGEGWPHRLEALPDGRIILHGRKSHPDDPREMELDVLQLHSPQMEYLHTIHEEGSQVRTWLADTQRDVPRPYMPTLQWALLPDGRIALGLGDEYRIEIHDVDDGLISSFEYDRPRVRVTESDRQQWLDGITWTGEGGVRQEGAPPWIVRNTEWPRFMPAFDLIIADSDGNLLVHAFREGVQEERFRYRYYDAFGPDGTFLGEVTLEGEGRFPILGAPIRNGRFCTCLTSESGEITFIRYRIMR